MAVLSADFELGTNGNDVLTSDPGSATAWDVKVAPGATTVTYDTTAAHGGLAMKCVNSTSAQGTVSWTTALGTVTDHYGRFYFRQTANPASFSNIMLMMNGAAIATYVTLLPSGHIAIGDKDAANIGETTNSIALNQWIRIEYHIIHSTTVGQVELKLFNSPESTTPTETVTTAADKNLLASADQNLYGIRGGQSIVTNYYDSIIANATSYQGPVAGASPTLRTVASNLRW